MREHRVLVNNKEHEVRLLDMGKTPYQVEVDDKTYKVDLSNEIPHGTPILIKVNGKRHKVEINKFSKEAPFHIKVNDRLFKVQYERSKRAPSQIVETIQPTLKKQPVESIAERNTVTAFMPGRVVLLKVKPGDSVKVGDTLCVLESMKMENEITAPKAGVVQEVKVSEGLMVNKGEPLVTIK